MRDFHIFTIALALVFTGCSDTITRSQVTRAAAQNTIDRGWIPRSLPASATQIHESHNIDTNVGHGTFAFGSSDAEQFQRSLTPFAPGVSLRAYRVSRSELERRGFALYREDDFDIAVDWTRRVGEFWLVSPRR